jgi:NAD(P)-dependent dehydrogenase (short-subunit alcohol dehydrogenase family)
VSATGAAEGGKFGPMTSTVRTALVTGSTDGIGKETALGLARAGMKVFVHGRSKPKVERAIAELSAQAPEGQFEGVSFDLGSMASIRRAVTELHERLDTLHVLINNAGIFSAERVITGDGAEATLAVNHVGHYLLTELMRPALARAGSARVIIVSSIAHTRGRIHLEDLTLEKAYTGYAAYAQSKLANVMHAIDLAAANDPAELAVYSLHPGVISTKLLREGFGPVRGSSPHHGAATSIRLATADSVAEPSGSYFSEGFLTPVASAANDAAAREALREATVRYAGLTAG